MCDHKARGNFCEKPQEPAHRLHKWDIDGKLYMWEDASTFRRGTKPYPKVGDNIRDFPDYRGYTGSEAVAGGGFEPL